MPDVNVDEVWQQVYKLLTKEDVGPPIWEAARLAKPLLVEDDIFILGFKPADMRHASYLQTNITASVLRKLLKQVTGQDLELRCIEGGTVEAWEHVKAREAATVSRLTGVYQKEAEVRSAQIVWSQLAEKLGEMFRDTRARSMPLTNARMLTRALPLVIKAEAEARATSGGGGPEAAEFHERELNRTFDRLATFCDLPAAAVALEYLRYVGLRRGQ